MKTRQLKVTIVLLMATLLLSVVPASATQQVWLDPFETDPLNPTLDPSWYWRNENPDEWSLTENPGYLRIYASPSTTGEENLLLRPAAGNFTIETHVHFEPYADFQFAGLVVFQNEASYLQLGRAFCDVEEEACVGNGIYFDHVADDTWVDGNFATKTDSAGEAYLRLEVQGQWATGFYSENSVSWQEIGKHYLPLYFANAVGLTASQDFFAETPYEVAADFDYFSFTGNLTASAKERVYIDPRDGYASIGPGQEPVLRWGWTACSPRLTMDFVDAVTQHITIYRDNVKVGEFTNDDGEWGTPFFRGTSALCKHGDGSMWRSWWVLDDLGIENAGTYEVSTHVFQKWPVVDGADFDPIDGHPDVYNIDLTWPLTIEVSE